MTIFQKIKHDIWLCLFRIKTIIFHRIILFVMNSLVLFHGNLKTGLRLMQPQHVCFHASHAWFRKLIHMNGYKQLRFGLIRNPSPFSQIHGNIFCSRVHDFQIRIGTLHHFPQFQSDGQRYIFFSQLSTDSSRIFSSMSGINTNTINFTQSLLCHQRIWTF